MPHHVAAYRNSAKPIEEREQLLQVQQSIVEKLELRCVIPTRQLASLRYQLKRVTQRLADIERSK
jgi:hypothetical protein